MFEQWRHIKGYEGLYLISDFGSVYGLTKRKMLMPYLNNRGYLKVDLYKGGKREKKFIHRLVAETYLPNPNNLLEVNHKDENKKNNHVSNLEFCDRKYNLEYGTARERAGAKHRKAVICVETKKVFKSITEASQETGICLPCISLCCRGKQDTASGFHWQFIVG